MTDRRPWGILLRALARKTALLLLGTLGGLLLCELLLRVYNPFFASIRGQHIVLQANVQIRIKNPHDPKLDPVAVNTRNSLGFRGPDPPADFSSWLSVVAVGGSTTACTYLSDGKDWPALLANKLGGAFKRVWVDNAGLDGHSTVGHLALMKDFVLPLHPKVVLFLVGGNDAALAYEGDVIEDEGLQGHHLDWNSPSRLYRELHTALNNHSEVLSLASDLHRSFLAYEAGLNRADTDFTKLGCMQVTEQAKQSYFAYYGARGLREAYKQRLNALIDLSRKAGIQPVFITQPTVLGPVRDDVTGINLGCVPVAADTNGDMVWELTERYNDVTREVGREADVPVIDLARALPKSTRYFYDFYHYGNLGSQTVAGIIDQSLEPVLKQRFPQYVRE